MLHCIILHCMYFMYLHDYTVNMCSFACGCMCVYVFICMCVYVCVYLHDITVDVVDLFKFHPVSSTVIAADALDFHHTDSDTDFFLSKIFLPIKTMEIETINNQTYK